MRKFILSLVAVLAISAPASAEFTATASDLVWETTRVTAEINELRDALLWYYDRQETLSGLVAQAARPHFAVASVGGGNSKMSITLPLAAGNTWVTAMAAVPCPAATTTADKRTCVDGLIKADFKRLWRAYRVFLREQSTPIVEPPNL
jgi:hypothetical protein